MGNHHGEHHNHHHKEHHHSHHHEERHEEHHQHHEQRGHQQDWQQVVSGPDEYLIIEPMHQPTMAERFLSLFDADHLKYWLWGYLAMMCFTVYTAGALIMTFIFFAPRHWIH